MEEVVNKVKELLFDKLDYIHCGSCRFYDDDTHLELAINATGLNIY